MFSDLLLRTVDDRPGYFEVVCEVTWQNDIDHLMIITVPGGYLTDLASIPRIIRPFFSQTGLSRKPAVFHDFMYATQAKTRKECDHIFYTMLLERGMKKLSAKLYYWGVRSGGWTRGTW